MTILGMILMVIGGVLFYGSKIVYNRNERKNLRNSTSKNIESVALVNSTMLASRTIGAILVIAGGILIVFIK